MSYIVQWYFWCIWPCLLSDCGLPQGDRVNRHNLPLGARLEVGAVRSVASSYAAMVAGSRPMLVKAWEWHIGLALLRGCSGALEYPTTNSCGPINKSLSLSLLYYTLSHKPRGLASAKRVTVYYTPTLLVLFQYVTWWRYAQIPMRPLMTPMPSLSVQSGMSSRWEHSATLSRVTVDSVIFMCRLFCEYPSVCENKSHNQCSYIETGHQTWHSRN